MFISKYGSLDIYDEDGKKIFIIDNEELQFEKIMAIISLEFLMSLIV